MHTSSVYLSFNLYCCVVILQYVYEPNLFSLEAVNLTVLNTLQTSLCSQIHVCIADYLSAINISETNKEFQTFFTPF